MPVRLAAVTNLAGNYTAKTLTVAANALLVIDGVAAAVGDRVLLAGQTTGTQNGVYVVSAPGSVSAQWALTRAEDFDDTGDIYSAVKISVAEGSTNDNATFILAANDPIVLDASPLEFSRDVGLVNVVREYIGNIVSADATLKTITHALHTKDVTVEITRDSDGATVLAGVTRPPWTPSS
jgi:hypothetical protein